MGFRHTLVRWFNAGRLAAFDHACQNPQEAQRRALARILQAHAPAAYLRERAVSPDASPDQLRAALPVVDYDDLRPYIEPLAQHGWPCPQPLAVAQRPDLLLKTSGTTGAAKLLPVTPAYVHETDLGRRVWIERMLAEDDLHGDGIHLAVISPMREATTPGGLPIGANTGRIFMRQPALIRAFAPVPYPVFAVADSALRYRLILRFAASRHDVGTFTTANPSTVLLLCNLLLTLGEDIADDVAAGRVAPDHLLEPLRAQGFGPFLDPHDAWRLLRRWSRPDPRRAEAIRRAVAAGPEGLLPRLWPRLTTVNCWLGGHAPFYLPRITPFLLRDGRPRVPLRDPGFSASEGLFGIPLQSETPEGVLHLAGTFMEFVPEDQPDDDRTLLAHELTPGHRYRLITTTGGGLWRYAMRDVVEVTGLHHNAPMVKFLYKSNNILNITGEKITEAHAVAAAADLAATHPVEHVIAGLELLDTPRYAALVEPRPGAALDPAALAARWDAALQAANVEYAEKRRSQRLGPPQVRLLPPGALLGWRARRVAAGAPDGQLKLPVLTRDLPALERDLTAPQEHAP